MTKTHDFNAYDWQGAGTPLPDGHRIFESHNPPERSRECGAWAIADDSGMYPEQTDDGVLWLDMTRPLLLSLDTSVSPHVEVLAIPVVDNDGEDHSVGTTAATILYLSRLFRWTVEDEPHGRYYGCANAMKTTPDPEISLLLRAHKSRQLDNLMVGNDIKAYLTTVGAIDA